MTWQPVGVTGTGQWPQPPSRHAAGTSGGQQRRRRAGGPDDDTAEWQVPRGSRADPKGPAQRKTPRGNRRVTIASDPSTTCTSAQRGGPAKNASTKGGDILGRPSFFAPLADGDDDEEMEAPPPPTTPAQLQQQQGNSASDGEEAPRPDASPPPAATDAMPRPPVRRRRRTPRRSTGGTGQAASPTVQQAGPGTQPQTGDRSRPPGEDGMTPGIFDQLSPGDRVARSAAFGCYGDQGPQSRDGIAEVVRQAARQKKGRRQVGRDVRRVSRLPPHNANHTSAGARENMQRCSGRVTRVGGRGSGTPQRDAVLCTWHRVLWHLQRPPGRRQPELPCARLGGTVDSQSVRGGRPRGGRKPHSATTHGRAAGGVGSTQSSVFALGPITYAESDVDAPPCKAAYAALADYNCPATVLQSALECIESQKRRARAAGAARDASPPDEDNDDPGKGREEFENFDPSRDNEDEATPTRRQRRGE
jgi:hypothetical protein